MDKKDRTREELLDEIHRLERKNQQMKASYEKEISDFKLEKELVETKMLSFEAVCESSPVPMLIIDETTNIVMANLAAIRLCDADEEEILNHRPGNALRCIHSSMDSRGCGYSVDCKICTLRNAVELLIKKGGSINGTEVEMSLLRNGELQKVWMNVGVEAMMLGGVKHWCVALNDISKHKLAAESLFQSESRFREVLENSMDASYKRNLQTNRYDYLSPVFGQIAGYSEEELKTLTAEVLWKQIHPDDLPEMIRLILNAITDLENKSYQIEYRFKHKGTGEYRWLYDKFTVMHDALGKSIALIGSVGDITARKKSEKELNDYKENLEKLITERTESLHHEIELRTMIEEALGESEAKYRNIVDYSTSIVLEWDTEGKVLFFNKYGLDFFGFSSEEIIGQNVTGTIVEPFDSEGNDLERKMKVIQSKPEDFYSSENENVRKNGEKVWIAWTNKGIYKDGQLMKTLSVGIDRTQQHVLEKSLQHYRGQLEKMVEKRTQELTLTNQQLVEEIKVRKKVEDSLKENERMLLESQSIARLGTFDFDCLTEIFKTSQMLDEIYGIDENYNKTLEGWVNLIHPDDRTAIYDFFINEVIAKGKPFDQEFRINRLNDGSPRWVHSLAKVETETDRKKLIGTTRDITAQKEAEEQLLIAKEKAEESDRLKTAFLNNISHEIRTPLNGILGFASYIVQPNIAQKEKEGYLSELTHSSFRLINTVTDFMDMSLIVSGNMHVNPQPIEIFSLMQILQQRFVGFSTEKKLELLIQQGEIPNEYLLKTDEELLMKALSHLLSNAIKFTAKGSIAIGYEFKTNELVLFVKDTGIGVSEEFKERVFDVFMQENVSDTRGYEGSGLGLSIAKGIVKLLGGKIRMESVKEVGTTVFVSFPVESNEIEKVNGTPLNEKQIDKVSFLLIAEDDDASYLFIETVMKKFSDHIIRAANGKEAVDLCLKNPDLDMVLMDIKMPLMDGYEATRKIRQFNKNVIIIAQTAYGLAGDKNKALGAGCNDYISKPINKDELYAIVLKRINV